MGNALSGCQSTVQIWMGETDFHLELLFSCCLERKRRYVDVVQMLGLSDARTVGGSGVCAGGQRSKTITSVGGDAPLFFISESRL